MGLVTLRDYRGATEVAVFLKPTNAIKIDLLDTPLVVRGKVATRNGEKKTIVIDEVKPLVQ